MFWGSPATFAEEKEIEENIVRYLRKQTPIILIRREKPGAFY